MLEKKNGKLVFPDYKLHYQSHGKDMCRYTSDKAYWQAFEKKHDHFHVIEFKETKFTDEQHKRLKEVEDIDEAFSHFAWEYAVNGLFPDELDGESRMENHPLKQLQLEKVNEQLGQQLSNIEIERFMDKQEGEGIAQQVTDLELRFMMGGL